MLSGMNFKKSLLQSASVTFNDGATEVNIDVLTQVISKFNKRKSVLGFECCWEDLYSDNSDCGLSRV